MLNERNDEEEDEVRGSVLTAAILGAMMLFAASAGAQVLKQEPPMGSIRAGETVLVDNGKCPKGQVMAVTGGNHVKAGGKSDVVRRRTCVKAPN
jgi:hypothetical protein